MYDHMFDFRYAKKLIPIDVMIQDTDLLFSKPECHILSKREVSPTMDRTCTTASFVQLNVGNATVLDSSD